MRHIPETRGEAANLAQSGRRELEPAMVGPGADARHACARCPARASCGEGSGCARGLSRTGLDDAGVRMRQAAFGRNALDLQPPKSAAVDPPAPDPKPGRGAAGAAAALSGALGDWREAIAILVVLGLNTA